MQKKSKSIPVTNLAAAFSTGIFIQEYTLQTQVLLKKQENPTGMTGIYFFCRKKELLLLKLISKST
jgi:hypothetical protein